MEKKNSILCGVFIWLLTTYAAFGQATYHADTKSYTVVGTVTKETNKDELEHTNPDKDFITMDLSRFYALDYTPTEAVDADFGTGGHVKVEVYLRDDHTKAFTNLIYGVLWTGTNTRAPTQTTMQIQTGPGNGVLRTVDSRQIKDLVESYEPSFNKVDAAVANIRASFKLSHDNHIQNALSWASISKSMSSVGLTVPAAVSKALRSWAGEAFLGAESISLGPVGWALASAAVMELDFNLRAQASPDNFDYLLVQSPVVSVKEMLRHVGHELMLPKVYVKVEMKDVTLRSISIPYAGTFDMSLFHMVETKNSFLVQERQNNNDVYLSAHRGYWRTVPSNSIASIKAAVLRGSAMAEMDLNVTGDGKVILMHDKTVNRTTNYEDHFNDPNDKKVLKLDYSELSQLKLLDRFGNVFLNDPNDVTTVERVPTLTEALTAAKGQILLNVDKFEQFIPEVYAAVIETGTSNQIVGKGYKSPSELIELLRTTKEKEEAGETDTEEWGDNIPGKTGEEKLISVLQIMDYTPIVNDWIKIDGHITDEDTDEAAIQKFIDQWKEYKVRAFETDPESYNSPVLPAITKLAKEKIHTGSFSPFADDGEGHSLQKGRVKFDVPFGMRGDWDAMIKAGVDFFVNDRSAMMGQYLDAIGARNQNPGRFNAISNNLSAGTEDVMVVAHRSAWQYAPENSMASFKLAVNMGVDVLEMDARLTKDGKAVVYHDWNLATHSNFLKHFGAHKYKVNDVHEPDANGNWQYFITKHTDGLDYWPDITYNNEVGKLVTSEIRHWNYDDIKDILLLDKDLNVSKERLQLLDDVLAFCKDKILVSLDKWNSCSKNERTCNPVAQLTAFLEIAENEGALGSLILGDLRTPRGSDTDDKFVAADYYTASVVQTMFNINGKDYLKEISYMPRVNVSMLGAGVEMTTYVDGFLNLTYTDENGQSQPYNIDAFLVKLPENVDPYAGGKRDDGKVNQDDYDELRELIYYIRSQGKRVYMAPSQSAQVGGVAHTDEAALIDPDAAWGWLIEKAGYGAKANTSPGITALEDKPGATMLESNYLYELLRYLRSKGLHD